MGEKFFFHVYYFLFVLDRCTCGALNHRNWRIIFLSTYDIRLKMNFLTTDSPFGYTCYYIPWFCFCGFISIAWFWGIFSSGSFFFCSCICMFARFWDTVGKYIYLLNNLKKKFYLFLLCWTCCFGFKHYNPSITSSIWGRTFGSLFSIRESRLLNT